MNLSHGLSQKVEWTLVGPMGPEVPARLRAHPLMGVDGGARFLEKMDVWVGDSDSFGETGITATEVFRHSPDKDVSDLALALELLRGSRALTLHLWGFTGGRADHALFVLGECLRFLDQQPESQLLLYSGTGKVLFHLVGAGQWRFRCEGTFSLGTLREARVRLEGSCRYQLHSRIKVPPLSSFGLSNVGFGEIELEVDRPVFLCFPETDA